MRYSTNVSNCSNYVVVTDIQDYIRVKFQEIFTLFLKKLTQRLFLSKKMNAVPCNKSVLKEEKKLRSIKI